MGQKVWLANLWQYEHLWNYKMFTRSTHTHRHKKLLLQTRMQQQQQQTLHEIITTVYVSKTEKKKMKLIRISK